MYYRRFRGDLVLTYRILTGQDGPDLSGLFHPTRVPTLRGHPLKLHKSRSDWVETDSRLSRPVTDSWNALPEEVVMAPSVIEYEHRFDALGIIQKLPLLISALLLCVDAHSFETFHLHSKFVTFITLACLVFVLPFLLHFTWATQRGLQVHGKWALFG